MSMPALAIPGSIIEMAGAGGQANGARVVVHFELFSFRSMAAHAKAGFSCVRDSGRGTDALIARQVGHAGSHGVGTMAGNRGRTMVASLHLVEHVDYDKRKLSTSFFSSTRCAWFHVEHSYSSDRIVKRHFPQSSTCRFRRNRRNRHVSPPIATRICSLFVNDP
jgi:hypothetical protein